MRNTEYVDFLRWALPQIGLEWRGFRHVRRQVCKRIGRRLAALRLAGLPEYRAYLASNPAEWSRLGELCRISISRFYRDRSVFDTLRERLLPELAVGAQQRGASSLRAWSAGCAAGEEPFSLALVWRLAVARRFPGLSLEIVATDADAHAVERAQRACYKASSLKELPAAWRAAAFEERDGLCCLREDLRAGVVFHCEDIRSSLPPGPFDLILCRNLVYTYFDEPTRATLTEAFRRRLVAGGVLIVGAHEQIDAPSHGFAPYADCREAYVNASALDHS